MESWEHLDIDEIWEAIWDASQFQPLNELEIYRKWIPRFNQRLQTLLKHHQRYIDRIAELVSKPDTQALEAKLAVTKFDLDKIRERNVKNVLALNALQKSAREEAEKIRNSDAVRYYTRFHCADELKQIATRLEASALIEREKNDNRRV